MKRARGAPERAVLMAPQELAETTSALTALGVAIAAGFLIGFEREWTQALEKQQHAFAGARTFTLVGAAGGLSGLLSGGAMLVAAGLLAVGALTLLAYSIEARETKGRGGTTEIALLVTFLLGAAAGRGEFFLASGGAVVIAIALSLKDEIKGLAGALNEKELHASLRFLAIAVLVLPVAPDADMGPYGALNPRSLWLMVVLISGLSFLGYWLVRAFGAAHGVVATGLVGGLASSTATTLSLARMARGGAAAPAAAAAGIVMANVVMIVRIVLLLAALAPTLLATLAPVFAASGAVGTVISFFAWRAFSKDGVTPNEVAVGNPFEIRPALVFALLLSAISIGSAVAADKLGEQGLYAFAFAAGLGDADAVVLPVARQAAAGSIAPLPGSMAVLLAIAANILSKGAMAFGVGGARVGASVIAGFAAMAAAGAATLFL